MTGSAKRKRVRGVERWGCAWRTKFGIEHLLYENLLPMLFVKKREAEAYIEQKYGYMRTRPDLRAAPHHWRMPIPVRVTVELISRQPGAGRGGAK